MSTTTTTPTTTTPTTTSTPLASQRSSQTASYDTANAKRRTGNAREQHRRTGNPQQQQQGAQKRYYGSPSSPNKNSDFNNAKTDAGKAVRESFHMSPKDIAKKHHRIKHSSHIMDSPNTNKSSEWTGDWEGVESPRWDVLLDADLYQTHKKEKARIALRYSYNTTTSNANANNDNNTGDASATKATGADGSSETTDNKDSNRATGNDGSVGGVTDGAKQKSQKTASGADAEENS